MKVVELTKQRDAYKKQSIAAYKLRTDLEFWRDMPAQEMRIRCGEISTQEMRTVRAVLSTILSENVEVDHGGTPLSLPDCSHSSETTNLGR